MKLFKAVTAAVKLAYEDFLHLQYSQNAGGRGFDFR